MILSIKRRIKAFLLNCGVYINATTSKEQVTEFLESLKPVATNHDLIRVGGYADGGYLIPNDIEGIHTCFSPGVCEASNFENDLTKRGVKCFLADYSVDAPPINNSLFDFEKKYLGSKNNEMFMTLEYWVQTKAPEIENSILQMDIEGAEYSVILDSTSHTLRKFRILVIEFHNLDLIFSKMGFELINLAFGKLLRDFEVVHIHPNNSNPPFIRNGLSVPPVMEFTFLRKDRVIEKSQCTHFPHVLDRASDTRKLDYDLPKCWYSARPDSS
ncbi:Methyltransferase FkbM [Burkholderiaceae bacterium]